MSKDLNEFSKEVESIYFKDKNLFTINPKLSKHLTICESIILQQVAYWVKGVNPNGKYGKQIDGVNWIYNSYKDWAIQLGYFSEITIKRSFLSLEKAGLIISANLNKDKLNQTKWYTLNLKKSKELLEGIQTSEEGTDLSSQEVSEIPCNVSERPRQGISGSRCNVSKRYTVPYIHILHTNTTTETNTRAQERAISFSNELISKEIEVKSNQEASKTLTIIQNSFEMFWAVYPVKKGKSKAREAFLRAINRTDLTTMLEAVKSQVAERAQEASLGVRPSFWPHPTTWLNQSRWEDEIDLLEGFQSQSKTQRPKSFREIDLELRSQAIPTLAEKLEMQESFDKAFEGGIRYRDE